MNFDEPSACRWCGISKQSHLGRWQKDVGWHQWIMPTVEQIKERMAERRASKKVLDTEHLTS